MKLNVLCYQLEESIDRLSDDLAKQKPAMMLHAARVQHLDAVLRALDTPSTDIWFFTTEIVFTFADFW